MADYMPIPEIRPEDTEALIFARILGSEDYMTMYLTKNRTFGNVLLEYHVSDHSREVVLWYMMGGTSPEDLWAMAAKYEQKQFHVRDIGEVDKDSAPGRFMEYAKLYVEVLASVRREPVIPPSDEVVDIDNLLAQIFKHSKAK